MAQAPEASYPVDPVAAAGMTSGLPNGTTYRQAEMMQVRMAAQGAQGEAAAAAMARSADQSIEDAQRQRALDVARTNKAIKEEMRNRLKYDRAAAAHNKVSAHDMSTWEQNGGVRVERNVPDAFLMSLIEAEEQAAARSGGRAEKKRFSLFGGDGGGDSGGDGGSFLGSIRPPRLPFVGGGGGGSDAPSPAPQASDTSEPVFAGGGSKPAARPAAAPAPSSPAKPGSVPMISGAALVDGRAPNRTPEPVQQRVSFSDSTPEPDRKKPGLFSRVGNEPEETSLVPTSSRESSSGGFFGFGKKKTVSAPVGIDASLFPAGSVDMAPTGGRLTGGARVASSASPSSSSSSSEEMSFATESGESFTLPGRTVEKEKTGFSLPKPSLSMPSIPSIAKSEGGTRGGGSVGSTGQYVVTQTAQFMVYGAEQMQSEIRALPAGTTVFVTKPGDQWAGIRLSDGTEGIVQNKNLRPAQ
ncbi:MAG TPA: hypothetical protein PLA50_16720 [Bacteroidia bacterium]|nr:hypothetical protein [Bacteroidia bacterium]